MKKLSKLFGFSLAGAASLLLPIVVIAQSTPVGSGSSPSRIDEKITIITNTMNNVVALLFILETIIFVWGLIRYIALSDAEAKSKAKGIMTWGIVALAVTVAAWGIAALLINYFGIGGGTIPKMPGDIK